jgi:radical SAM protein with 4Fe4S-binding SPASM domain
MQIYLKITEHCSLKCSHCIRGTQKKTELSNLGITKIVQLLSAANIKQLVITGGEPTEHSHILDIFQKISKLTSNIIICSNGVNTNIISKIASNFNCTWQISLDGDEDCHNKIRGKKCYDKVILTIQNLINQKQKVIISTTVDSYNAKSLLRLHHELSKFDDIKWKIKYKLPFGCASEDDILPIERWNALCNFLLKKIKTEPIPKIKPLFVFPSNLIIDKYKLRCGTATSKLYIETNLDISLCTCLPFHIGNLFDISDWNEVKKILKYWAQKISISPSSPCSKCVHYPLCKGGCVGMSYKKFGRLNYGDYRCPYFKKLYTIFKHNQ